MANILILNQTFVTVGLGTLTFTVRAAGDYNVKVDLTENPPSGLTISVNKNTVSQFTSPVITPTQSAQQFKVYLPQLAINDVIDVVLSSASAIDSQLNTVKSNISIGQGAS